MSDMVVDPFDPPTLLAFAAASQLHASSLTQQQVAHLAGMAPTRIAELTHGKLPAARDTLRERLRRLDGVLANQRLLRHHSLLGLHEEMFPGARAHHAVPAYWADDLLRVDAETAVVLFLQATAVDDQLGSGPSDQAVHALDRILGPLLGVGGLPPWDGVQALQLVAGFADHPTARGPVFRAIEAALGAPVGFRAWRAVSLILMRHRQRSRPVVEELRGSVEQLFASVGKHHDGGGHQNANPSRSLDIEAAAMTPEDWDFANDYLRREAQRPEATARQRGYAAAAHWERTRDPQLQRTLVEDLRQESPESHLGWVRRGAEQLLAGGSLGELPAGDELGLVRRVAGVYLTRAAGIAPRCRHGASELLAHGLLSNHGVVRRRCFDALRTAALAEPVTLALREIVLDRGSPVWLRGRVALALSFLGHRGEATSTALELLVDSAGGEREVPDDVRGAVEAAAWAVGDVWAGDDGADVPAWVPDRLGELLRAHWAAGTRAEQRIARAAAYSLAVVGHPAAKASLGEVRTRPGCRDEVTANLVRWAWPRYDGDRPRSLYALAVTGRSR